MPAFTRLEELLLDIFQVFDCPRRKPRFLALAARLGLDLDVVDLIPFFIAWGRRILVALEDGFECFTRVNVWSLEVTLRRALRIELLLVEQRPVGGSPLQLHLGDLRAFLGFVTWVEPESFL